MMEGISLSECGEEEKRAEKRMIDLFRSSRKSMIDKVIKTKRKQNILALLRIVRVSRSTRFLTSFFFLPTLLY